MNGTARDAEETRRLALALLLALGLHAALLLGIPTQGWSLRHPQTLRFEVALLPPITRPNIPQPTPGPAESPAVVVPEPALPPAEPPPVAPPSTAPASTPPPKPIPPPKPVVAVRPAPKPAAPAAKPVKPPAVANITPAPRTVVQPAAPPKPVKPPVAPSKPIHPPQAKVEPPVKPPAVNPPPAPVSRFTPAESARPSVEKPLARPIERSGRDGTASVGGRSGRLDSVALLGQIAGLDAETQQRASRIAREQRVSLADTRSLAGFYAADWARKVTRVGEMNFPDAARRLNLSAGPLLDVAIRADGSLRDVRILRSSGNAELDQAARRIVQLAAPYPPFPPELRQQVDLLRIEAPWRFDPGGRVRVR